MCRAIIAAEAELIRSLAIWWGRLNCLMGIHRKVMDVKYTPVSMYFDVACRRCNKGLHSHRISRQDAA